MTGNLHPGLSQWSSSFLFPFLVKVWSGLSWLWGVTSESERPNVFLQTGLDFGGLRIHYFYEGKLIVHL